MTLGLQIDTVKLSDHDDSWHEIFLSEKEKLQEILGDKVEGIEHVGSTAIKGIKAKPILDLMVGVKTLGEPEEYTSDLQKLGYEFRRDFRSNQQHILFVKGPEENRTHYLKLTFIDSDFWREHILFRNFLNVNPQYAKEYENLKIKLLEEYGGERGPYTAGKNKFIKKILGLAGYQRKDL
ncbi:MAG: GrpB family protein [bacterium]|nr:GrpB family protein [bacterium]